LDDPVDLVAPDPPVAAPVDPEEAEPDELAVPAAFVPGDVGTLQYSLHGIFLMGL
jgi:hypothetical protein